MSFWSGLCMVSYHTFLGGNDVQGLQPFPCLEVFLKKKKNNK